VFDHHPPINSFNNQTRNVSQFMLGGVCVDTIQILERLVSIKSNAQERARKQSNEYLGAQHEMKASILENGIEQLIIEIQNSILAEYKTSKKIMFYKSNVSSQAS